MVTGPPSRIGWLPGAQYICNKAATLWTLFLGNCWRLPMVQLLRVLWCFVPQESVWYPKSLLTSNQQNKTLQQDIFLNLVVIILMFYPREMHTAWADTPSVGLCHSCKGVLDYVLRLSGMPRQHPKLARHWKLNSLTNVLDQHLLLQILSSALCCWCMLMHALSVV